MLPYSGTLNGSEVGVGGGGAHGQCGDSGVTLWGWGSLIMHWWCCLSGKPLSSMLFLSMLWRVLSFPPDLEKQLIVFCLNCQNPCLFRLSYTSVESHLDFRPICCHHFLELVTVPTMITPISFSSVSNFSAPLPLCPLSQLSSRCPVMVGLEEEGHTLFWSLLEGRSLTLNVTQRPSQSHFLQFGFRSSTIFQASVDWTLGYSYFLLN